MGRRWVSPPDPDDEPARLFLEQSFLQSVFMPASQEVITTGTISPTVETITSSGLSIGVHGTNAFNLMTFGTLGCNRAIFGYHDPCENRQSNLSAAGEAVTTGNA